MKTDEEKEHEIRCAMAKDEDYKLSIVCMIASCISSNMGGKEERMLEIGIALKMIENTRLTDLAKLIASHSEDGISGDTIFNLWWLPTQRINQDTEKQ